MAHSSVSEFASAAAAVPRGVVGVLLCETPVHARAAAARMARLGTSVLIALGDVPDLGDPGCPVITIAEPVSEATAPGHLNALIDALAGRWILWQRNGEFFFFPYCESRKLGDLAQFLADERRKGIYTYALDLYGADLPGAEEDPEHAGLLFDTAGYYAYPLDDNRLELFGGLGWRYQELLPQRAPQIGRTAFFRAERGAHVGPGMVFEDPAYSSVSAPWHHSPTAAIMTLRRAERILAHPNFAPLRETLVWQGSTPFEWTSRQLLDLGMIEPGQWF